MQEYSIELTLVEPVCIAAKRGVGNVIPTLDYLPGSSLRGALAHLWLQENATRQADGHFRFANSQDEAQFERLFLHPDVRYSQCTVNNARVLPQTAMSCKNYSGIGKGKHGLVNVLASDAKAALDASCPVSDLSCRSPNCDGVSALDAMEGFYIESGGELVQQPIARRFMTRTRISEIFDTAHHAALYTRTALEAQQSLTGKIRLHDNADGDVLARLLAKQQDILHLGAAKSRSTGRAEVTVTPYYSTWSDENALGLEERLHIFQSFFTGMKGYFWEITLFSDAILQDDYLRFKSWIDISDIANCVAENMAKNSVPVQEIARTQQIFQHFELVRCWSKTTPVAGWQSAWLLPKFEQTAIKAGSVFLFRCENPDILSKTPDPQTGKSGYELFVAALKSLEENSLGERRNEGFGQLKICDFFHLEEEWQ